MTEVIIYEMIAEERGLPIERIEPTSCLVTDLGMDGDDAVDFFQSIEAHFGTDLSNLHQDWDLYFAPEGISCMVGLLVLPAAIAGGGLAALLGLSNAAGFLIALALVILGFWLLARRKPKHKWRSITPSDVAQAVEAGVWPAREEES